jgi:hypothetical protein
MTRKPGGARKREIFFVLSFYLVLSCAMTWPLAAGLARDVPGDLGDSLLNMWILGWGAENLPRVLVGDMTPGQVANANIFHPEPLALALSENLFGQVLQILPAYYLTGNLILCYNLLFLSTFVLSGVGMYLLVRDVTGDRYAALLAGLLFAFVPYRVAQIGHLQILSAQWMPFALYGFRRYITTSHVTALLGGSLALLMQNWSCGYYLIYFAPFVLIFVVHQIAAAGRLRDRSVWVMFAAAGAVVALGTWPLLALYLEAQRLHAFERPLGEIIGFSADVYSYLTAAEGLRVLGPSLQTWPKPEGELFLGFVPTGLAALGAFVAVRAARADARGSQTYFKTVPGRRLQPLAVVTFLLGVFACALLVGFVGILFTGGFVTSLAGIPIRATNAPRLLGQLAIVLAAAVLVSGKFRFVCARFATSAAGLAAISLVVALWLSLGPVAHTRGQTIEGLGLYGLLLEYVPGFGGLRVPARYAMIAALYLSVLAGIGAAWLMRPRFTNGSARPMLMAASLAFLIEAAFVPMAINQTWGDGAIVPPPRVEPASSAPAVYRQLSTMPGDLALVEFPFGDPAWELRYVYYSTVHWKRLVNGYSGSFPQGYNVRVALFQRIATAPDQAWAALAQTGATHAIVHEAALATGEARLIRAWLESRGGREIGRFGSDVLYDLPHAR